MSPKKSLLDSVVAEMSAIFDTLLNIVGDSTTDPSDKSVRVMLLLRSMGWDVPTTVSFSGNTLNFLNTVEQLRGLLNAPSPDFLQLTESLIETAEGFNDFPNQLASILSGQLASEIISGLPIQLLDYLVSELLEIRYPQLLFLLKLLGIYEESYKKEDLSSWQIPYTKKEFHWQRVKVLFTEPHKLPEYAFGWGTSTLEYNKFFNMLQFFFRFIGIPATYKSLSDTEYNTDIGSAEEGIYIPILDSDIEIGLEIFPVPKLPPPDHVENDEGLGIAPYVEGSTDINFDVSDLVTITIRSNVDLDRTAGITIRPKTGIGFFSSIANVDGKFSVELAIEDPEKKLIGEDTKGTRFELKQLGMELFASLEQGTPDLGLELDINGFKFIIQSDEGDSFIQKILPTDPIILNADVTLGFSKQKKFYIKGGAGFEFTYQINTQLGPVYISTFTFGIQAAEKVSLIAGIDAKGEFGPFSASVKGIGLSADFDFNKPGILGVADLNIGFKLPNAIGLALDAGGIKGGGYLDIDPPNYSGILQLSVQDMFSVTAIGQLTTKLPDGSNTVSMVLALMATFTPSIQLGLGFALSGVGGLLGINRSMQEDALRDAVNNHTLDHVLFPEDPIRDAIEILETIGTIFIPNEGTHVFGPMVKITWGGTEELVTFDIGVFVEFGMDLKIAILGSASSILPTKDVPVLTINLDVLGFIDFGKKTLNIDMSIYDSHLLDIASIYGDMVLRSSWGTNPDFGMSFGGFHPRFTPPPTFPSMKRLTIQIGGPNPRLTLETYFAITTNSFQIGAKVEFVAYVASFSVRAGLEFDALLIFNPFSFDVGIAVYAGVYAGSTAILDVFLGGNLSGPNPVTVAGRATITILFFSVSLDVCVTIGDEVPSNLPEVSPAEELQNQLGLATPKAVLPDWANEGVIVTEDAEDFLSPIGEIWISQNAVPLELEMDLFGAGVPPDEERKLSLDLLNTDLSLVEPAPTTSFPPAQFIHMNDNEKMSSPAYENYTSGVRVKSNDVIPSSKNSKEFIFKTSIINTVDENDVPIVEHVPEDVTPFSPNAMTGDNIDSEILTKAWSQSGKGRFFKSSKSVADESDPNFIKINQPQYTLSSTSVKEGKFVRTVIDKNSAQDMNYFEAKREASRSSSEVVIHNRVYTTGNMEEEA